MKHPRPPRPRLVLVRTAVRPLAPQAVAQVVGGAPPKTNNCDEHSGTTSGGCDPS